MVNTLDMQEIRYLNLFEKIMKVRTRFCFKYNETIVFCVPRELVSRAVGADARNVKKMSQILGRRIKIVPAPEGIKDAGVFVRSVVAPVVFRNLEVNDNEIIVTGGKSKAALIGRNKRRFFEMQKIIRGFFGKDFRII